MEQMQEFVAQTNRAGGHGSFEAGFGESRESAYDNSPTSAHYEPQMTNAASLNSDDIESRLEAELRDLAAEDLRRSGAYDDTEVIMTIQSAALYDEVMERARSGQFDPDVVWTNTAGDGSEGEDIFAEFIRQSSGVNAMGQASAGEEVAGSTDGGVDMPSLPGCGNDDNSGDCSEPMRS